MITLIILLAIAVGLLSILVFGLLRTHAEILRSLDRAGLSLDGLSDRPAAGPVLGPQPGRAGISGALSPESIIGTSPTGAGVQVSLSGEHHTLLAFLSSGCRTCKTFWEEFRDPQLLLPGDSTRLIIVAQDPAHDSVSRLIELSPPGVRVVCSSDTWQELDVPGSPFFALVDGRTRSVVGSGTATSWAQVADLLQQALADSAHDPRHRGVDEILDQAGIGPGHASLYPPPSRGSSEADLEITVDE